MRTPQACVLSLSDLTVDSRVRRQCQLLKDLGYEVTAVGYSSGWRSDDPFITVEIARPAASSPRNRPVLARAITASRLLLTRTPLSRRAALAQYWALPVHRALSEAAAAVDADLIVANDWNTLPVAGALADRRGVAFCYDSHEYAVARSYGSRRFAWFYAPLIRAIESLFIRQAEKVFTVSDGISDCLQRDYGLDKPPIVVRNTPNFENIPARRTEPALTVLYHGRLMHGRGLDNLVRSVRLWRPEFRLVIRGNASPRFRDHLMSLAETVCRDGGLERSRIEFTPAVPVADVVQQASRADIGISLLPHTQSPQIQYALPNKFFEYVMAGLALCVPDLPAMRELVDRYALGVVMSRQDPDGIAAAINSLDRERIAYHRRKALAAAKELGWEREGERLAAALAAIGDAA